MPVDMLNGTAEPFVTRNVYYNDSVIPLAGSAVFYDRTRSTVEQRNHYVTRATLANAVNDLAGVVVSQGKHTTVGPKVMSIIEIAAMTRGVQVLTDENIAVGDYLAPIPGNASGLWGKAVFGTGVFRATEAVDGSGTNPALVTGDLGWNVAAEAEQALKIQRFFDHFNGASGGGVSTTADAAKFLLSGTSAAGAFADDWGPEKVAAQSGSGVLALTTNTTNQANLTLNGEPFRLDAGKSLFMRARFANSSISATTDTFVGVGATDTTQIAGANDYIGFRVANATLTVRAQKGGSGEVSIATGTSLVANEFVDVAILVRNRAAAVGKKEITIWVNGTIVSTYTNNDTDRAEIPDDQSLTFIAETVGSAARTLYLDYASIVNYIG